MPCSCATPGGKRLSSRGQNATLKGQVPPLSASTTTCGTRIPPLPPLKNKTKGQVPGKEHTPRVNTAPRQRKLQEQAAGAVLLPGCPSEGQTLQSPNSGQEISVLFCRFESVYEDNSEGCTPILSHQQSCLCEFRGLIIAPNPFSSVPMHKQNSKVMYTMGYSYSNGLWVVHAAPKT